MTITTPRKLALAAAAITISASAFASKPTSIKLIEDIVDGDNIYSHYIVKCSNGKTADISAWDNRKKWCVGKGGKDDCTKKQIKTARKVCR
ncbi:MAG: hypothetical protein V7459_04965 [Oceanicoccus sp.]